MNENKDKPDKFGEEKPSQLPYEGQETVPEHATGGLITACGIAGAFALVLGVTGAISLTDCFGKCAKQGANTPTSVKIPFTPREVGTRSPKF